MGFLFFFFSVEHILNMAMIMYAASLKTPNGNIVQELFKTQAPFVFDYTEFTWWKAIVCKWFNLILTFAWSYSDIFVILISVGLSTMFKRINRDLERCRGKHMSDKFWIMRRIQYRKVRVLVDHVDRALSPTIFVSVATDLLFVCAQLHNSLQ